MSVMNINIINTGLAGALLAPALWMATLPLSLQFVAVMMATLPASLLMARFGRRPVFIIGVCIALTATLIQGLALIRGDFTLFISGSVLLGFSHGTAQFYRYAAADAVAVADKSKAVSFVLLGGLFAALVGPEIAYRFVGAVDGAPYAGAFFGAAGVQFFAFFALAGLDIPPPDRRARAGRPLSAFFASVYSATNYLWIRNGEYKKLQNLLVRRSFVNISIQIFGGLISMGSFGLIGGHIIQNMPVKLKKELRLISLFRSIFFNPGRFIKKYNLIPIFKKYNRYPKFSTIESFISSISAHFPLLVVATTLDTKTAGLVFLGARLLLLPTNLLGRHVAQVNVSWSRKLLQRSDFVAQCVKVSASLTLISLLIFLFLKVLYFYGLPENLNDWEGLPSMLLTLAPWFLIQLIVSPMTSILHITNELKKSLAINIFGTVLRLSAIYIAIWLGLNYVLNILVYTSAAYYFLFAIIITHSLFNWKQGESDV